MAEKSIRYYELDIAKGLGILFVVLGHSFPNSLELSGASSILYNTLYSFHMPMFFFFSGLVSKKLLTTNKNEKIEALKNRFIRLMVPYFVFAVIYIPLRIIMAEYSRFSYDFTKLYTVFLGNNPNGELWFLYVLFWFSIVAILFANKKNIKFITVFALAVTLCSPLVPYAYNGISASNSLFQVFFFFLGIFTSIYYEKVRTIFKLHWFAVFTAAFIAFEILLQTTGIYVFKIFTSLFATLGVLCISSVIARSKAMQKINVEGYFSQLGQYSMDIYIFHSPVAVIMRILLFSYLEIGGAVYTILTFFISTVISYFGSKLIVRKVKLLRLLLLGMK